jgi:hypothetical protein
MLRPYNPDVGLRLFFVAAWHNVQMSAGIM